MIHHNARLLQSFPGLIFGIVLFLGCSDADRKKHNNKSEGVPWFQLTIKSDFSCSNVILIDEKGIGTSLVGTPKGHQIDSVWGRKDFIIASSSDKQLLNDAVDSILNHPSRNPIPMNDSYRFILKIENRIVLDTYDQGAFLRNILILLLPYVERVENGQCDFFNLYRKIYDQYIKPEKTQRHRDSSLLKNE